jgi:hypothetical protein
MNITEDKRLTVISGAFGTGKTEVSINIALKLKEQGVKKILLVDLDIVNVYFRSRQKAYELEKLGIHVISSQPGLENADLPALSPEIMSSFDSHDASVIFDLGGSDLGATVLSRFKHHFINQGYNHWLVINPYRPFNENKEDTMEMSEKIATKSRLPITGIIANPHLLNQTNSDVINKGIKKIQEITEYPLKLFAVMNKYYDKSFEEQLGVPALIMDKQMKQPWEKGGIKM